MNTPTAFRRFAVSLVVLLLLAFLLPTRLAAQGILSVDPDYDATGVSPTKAVVFSFDLPMDQPETTVFFIPMAPPFSQIPFSTAWTLDRSQLTCTPINPWPSGTTIMWVVSGSDALGDPVEGEGQFTVGSSGGHGTNALTHFVVQADHFYGQTNAVVPTLDPDLGYTISAFATLASNRTATAITVTLPTSATVPLTQNFIVPEQYYAFDSTTNLTTFNASYPGGNYTFNVTGTPSDLTATANLPLASLQPGVATVDNFDAAQQVNPTQPFTLNWSLPANSPAADFIVVELGPFKTPDPGEPDALTGAARSVVIPAGAFTASTTYEATIMLFRGNYTTNTTYTTAAFRATATTFDLKTTSGVVSGPVSLGNVSVLPNGNITFDIVSSPGQAMILEGSATLLPGNWSPVATNTSPSGSLTFIVTPTPATPMLFYRVQKVP